MHWFGKLPTEFSNHITFIHQEQNDSASNSIIDNIL